jgi:hypothetical protein
MKVQRGRMQRDADLARPRLAGIGNITKLELVEPSWSSYDDGFNICHDSISRQVAEPSIPDFEGSPRLQLGCSHLPSSQFTGFNWGAPEYEFAMVSDAKSAWIQARSGAYQHTSVNCLDAAMNGFVMRRSGVRIPLAAPFYTKKSITYTTMP